MRRMLLLSIVFLAGCDSGDGSALVKKDSPLSPLTEINPKLAFTCVHETIPTVSVEADALFQYARWMQKDNLLKRERIKAIKRGSAEWYKPPGLAQGMAAQKIKEIEAIENSLVSPVEIPGLKIHLCSLVAPDSPAGTTWMPVYVHSKLMIINQDDPAVAFNSWSDVIAENKLLRHGKKVPCCSLVEFYYGEKNLEDLD